MTTPMPLRVKVARAILGGDTHYPDGAVIMDSHRVEALASADRALAAMQEDAAARGMVLVPLEPTPMMVNEACYHWGPWLDEAKTERAGRYDDSPEAGDRAREVWVQMLAAHEAETLAALPAPPSAPTIAPGNGNG